MLLSCLVIKYSEPCQLSKMDLLTNVGKPSEADSEVHQPLRWSVL